jgi:L-fucose isomerase-like protein
MLATSGVLNTMGVSFTYINNGRIDDAEFQQGVDRFVRAAQVVKTLKTMRIGQIGQRIDFFWSTLINEADLLKRFGSTAKQ